MTPIYLVFTAIIAYAGFCRLVQMDASTPLPTRVAFWLLTVSAAAGAAAALIGEYTPQWPDAFMAGAVALTLVVSSGLWHNGVPRDYKTAGWTGSWRTHRRDTE